MDGTRARTRTRVCVALSNSWRPQISLYRKRTTLLSSRVGKVCMLLQKLSPRPKTKCEYIMAVCIFLVPWHCLLVRMQGEARLLLFLRPVKVGSTSLMGILHSCATGSLCSKPGYRYLGAQVCRDTYEWRYNCSGGSADDPSVGNEAVGTRIVRLARYNQFERQLRSYPRPAALSSHAPFFSSMASRFVLLMAVLRDPIARSLSHFNYMFNEFICPKVIKYGIDASIYGRYDCSVFPLTTNEVYVRALNGSDPVLAKIFFQVFANDYSCLYGRPNPWTRHCNSTLASHNLRTHFSWVGILEHWEESIYLLPLELPMFFSSLMVTRAASYRLNVRKARPRMTMIATSQAEISRILAPDFEVYSDERQRLRQRVLSASVR